MNLFQRLEKRTDSAEVFTVERNSRPVEFKSGRLDSVKSVSTTGKAVRVIKDGRIGFSSTTDLEDEEEPVSRAVNSSRFGDRIQFDFSDSKNFSFLDCFHDEVRDFQLEEQIRMGLDFVEQLKRFEEDLEIDLSVTKSISNVRITSTAGLDAEESLTHLALNVSVQKVEEGDIFNTYATTQSRDKENFSPRSLADKIIRNLKWGRRSSAVSSGKQPVIFTPRGVLVLILPLVAGLNGRNVFLGSSPLAGTLGERVFDEAVNLTDDGRRVDSPSVRTFDDEGAPTTEKALIEDGVVSQFLYDLKTAGMASAETTGNGFKGGLLGGSDFRSTPSVAPSSLVLETGGSTLGEIIKDIEQGLLVDQVLGLGQGNVISGEFSNNVSVGYKIKDGTIMGKVKDTMIAGNVYDLLSDSFIEVGRIPEWVGGILYTPPVAVDGVSVINE